MGLMNIKVWIIQRGEGEFSVAGLPSVLRMLAAVDAQEAAAARKVVDRKSYFSCYFDD